MDQNINCFNEEKLATLKITSSFTIFAISHLHPPFTPCFSSYFAQFCLYLPDTRRGPAVSCFKPFEFISIWSQNSKRWWNACHTFTLNKVLNVNVFSLHPAGSSSNPHKARGSMVERKRSKGRKAFPASQALERQRRNLVGGCNPFENWLSDRILLFQLSCIFGLTLLRGSSLKPIEDMAASGEASQS